MKHEYVLVIASSIGPKVFRSPDATGLMNIMMGWAGVSADNVLAFECEGFTGFKVSGAA